MRKATHRNDVAVHMCPLLRESGVSVALVLASLGELLANAGKSVDEGKPYFSQQRSDPKAR